METLLDEADSLKYVEEDHSDMVEFSDGDNEEQKAEKLRQATVHEKRDRKCKSQILQRNADSHLEYTKDKSSAFKLWTSLEETFERRGIASQLLIRKSLLSMKFDAKNNTLANHFLQFDKLIRNLRTPDGNLEELDIVCHLLLTMPFEYNNVVTAIETLASDQLTVGFVKNRLLDEETKRNDTRKPNNSELSSSTAFVTQQRQNLKTGQGNSQSGLRFPFTCHCCQKRGYEASECKKKAFDQKNEKTRSANASAGAENDGQSPSDYFSATTQNQTSNDVKFYLDSGATEHVISRSVKLNSKKKLEVPLLRPGIDRFS